jgi:hypothetical protein
MNDEKRRLNVNIEELPRRMTEIPDLTIFLFLLVGLLLGCLSLAQ